MPWIASWWVGWCDRSGICSPGWEPQAAGVIAGALAEAGWQLGRDRFFEVLREQDLLLARRRSERPRTTNSYHRLPVFRNLVKGREVTVPMRFGWGI